MEIIDLKLNGLKLIKPRLHKDERGFFLETYQSSTYCLHGIDCSFVQDNHSFSQHGCLRGMHFQSQPGQAKLVRAGVGKIFDVAVDIRPHSSTYKQWEGIILDDQQHWQLFIPNGFAHGFCVLSEHAHVLYKVSTPYNAKYEKGFRWDDPIINIQWPIQNMILSNRDLCAPNFLDIEIQGEQ